MTSKKQDLSLDLNYRKYNKEIFYQVLVILVFILLFIEVYYFNIFDDMWDFYLLIINLALIGLICVNIHFTIRDKHETKQMYKQVWAGKKDSRTNIEKPEQSVCKIYVVVDDQNDSLEEYCCYTNREEAEQSCKALHDKTHPCSDIFYEVKELELK